MCLVDYAILFDSLKYLQLWKIIKEVRFLYIWGIRWKEYEEHWNRQNVVKSQSSDSRLNVNSNNSTLGRKSKLTDENKTILYKTVIKSIQSYHTPAVGFPSLRNTNIKTSAIKYSKRNTRWASREPCRMTLSPFWNRFVIVVTMSPP